MVMLYFLVVGLAAGFLLGGRLAGLGQIEFRWAPLAILGLLVQLMLFSPALTGIVGELGPPLYITSTVAVLAVVVRNLRVAPGLGIVALGALANLTAILGNGGFMPATSAALAASGHGAVSGYSNSVELARPAFEALVDRFALPPGVPFANVFSVGDVLIGLGVAIVIVVTMRSSRPSHKRAAG